MRKLMLAMTVMSLAGGTAVRADEHPHVYYVQGDVNKPGRFEVKEDVRVLAAIKLAGGLTATANPEDLRLVRPADDSAPAKVIRINYEGISAGKDMATNYAWV